MKDQEDTWLGAGQMAWGGVVEEYLSKRAGKSTSFIVDQNSFRKDHGLSCPIQVSQQDETQEEYAKVIELG
jgi:hypothetical protein